MKKYIYFFIIISFSGIVWGSKPDWVENYGKSDRYASQLYLTGFGAAALSQDKNELNSMDIAVQNARKELSNKIYLSIKSHSKMQIVERDNYYSQFYISITHSASHLNLWGCEVDKFYDKRSKTAYALVYVRREKLIDHYKGIADRLQNNIRHYYNLGKTAEQQGEKSPALKYYLRCYPLINRMLQARAIIQAASSSQISAFAELEDNIFEKKVVSITELNKAVQNLFQQPIKNLEDLALYVFNCLSDQLNTTRGTLIILPFTFQNTGMSSEFAASLDASLKSNITSLSGFSILANFDSDIEVLDFANADSLYVLSGSYWLQKDSIKVIAEISNYQHKQIMASMNVIIPQRIVENNGCTLQPQNFAQALKEQQIFTQGEINDEGLFLEAWTNKGKNGVVFFDDEIMNVYLKVNLPCYIRLIYHLASGVRTVLLDNYFIDRSYVNHAYKIPLKFVCDQPFGVEVLQIFAQTKPFKKVDTELQEGYQILQEDLYSFLSKTRGMKRMENSDVLKTEQRIVITSMEH